MVGAGVLFDSPLRRRVNHGGYTKPPHYQTNNIVHRPAPRNLDNEWWAVFVSESPAGAATFATKEGRVSTNKLKNTRIDLCSQISMSLKTISKSWLEDYRFVASPYALISQYAFSLTNRHYFSLTPIAMILSTTTSLWPLARWSSSTPKIPVFTKPFPGLSSSLLVPFNSNSTLLIKPFTESSCPMF